MATVNVHEAKTHLSRLLVRAAAGEKIIIAKGGKPIVRLVPVGPSRRPRKPGSTKGIRIHEDFDAPLPPEMGEALGG